MTRTSNKGAAPSPQRLEILQWTARMGAVTAEALADRQAVSLASARGRLRALVAARWLSRKRPLAGRPALYTLTRAGMHACALQGLDPCRLSASNAGHLIECARAAAALERCYPDHRVIGERELRRDERELGRALASVRLGMGANGEPLMHRPDLVLWSRGSALDREESPVQDGEESPVLDRERGPVRDDGAVHDGDELPVPVEVELTIKSPKRLTAICLAWARCRTIAGVLYLAPPQVQQALERAIERAQAEEQVVVVGLDALPHAAIDEVRD